jgi:hypothetical protein
MTPLQIAQFVLYCIFGLFGIVTTLVMASWGLSKLVHGKKEEERSSPVQQSSDKVATHSVELAEVQVTLVQVEKRVEAVLAKLEVLNTHDAKIVLLENQFREIRSEVDRLREWRHGAANDIMGHLSRLSLYMIEHPRTSSHPDGGSGISWSGRTNEVKR